MFDIAILNEDLAAVQNGFAQTDGTKMLKRQMGLRLLVEARPDQDRAAVEAVFAGIHPAFEVTRLYPEDLFTPVSADYAAPFPQYTLGYVATLAGIEAGDMRQNPYDLAYLVQQQGQFTRVDLDLPVENPMAAQSSSESSGGDPTPEAPRNHAWSLEAIRARQAWIATGRNRGRGIMIGHPDTGWTPHAKWRQGGLATNLGRNFLPNESPHDSSDRMISGGTYQPGHGTHTAAVMTFQGDVLPDGSDTIPSNEATGVAPDAVNIPIRSVLSVILFPTQTEVAQAIMYAVQRNCQVISLSLGGSLLWAWLGGPLTLAKEQNRIVVAASGNYPNAVLPGFRFTVEPASYRETIGVAGCTVQDVPWESSGRVPWGTVDIAAPGENVWTGLSVAPGQPDFRFVPGSGTSYATAQMAGVAALWMSHHFPNGYNGRQPAVEVFREHIKRTARKPRGWNDWFGAGIVDAHALVTTRPNLNMALANEADERAIVQEDPLCLKLGGTSSAATHSLLAGLLNAAEPGVVSAHATELAYLLDTNPALRLDLGKLLGSVPDAAQPDPDAVKAQLVRAVQAHGSRTLKATLQLD